jgi:hypothetical protein
MWTTDSIAVLYTAAEQALNRLEPTAEEARRAVAFTEAEFALPVATVAEFCMLKAGTGKGF